MPGPDATWWDQQKDDLGHLPRDRASLEAEVRRLRAALLRIRDELATPQSWEELRAAGKRCELHALEGLAIPSRKPGQPS